ncbi:hypothetical protein FQR65_LT20683 [Abscondita terminalis]|nr:hypothetical protein FQR65_LT20683 [Abscondita terminalis]
MLSMTLVQRLANCSAHDGKASRSAPNLQHRHAPDFERRSTPWFCFERAKATSRPRTNEAARPISLTLAFCRSTCAASWANPRSALRSASAVMDLLQNTAGACQATQMRTTNQYSSAPLDLYSGERAFAAGRLDLRTDPVLIGQTLADDPLGAPNSPTPGRSRNIGRSRSIPSAFKGAIGIHKDATKAVTTTPASAVLRNGAAACKGSPRVELSIGAAQAILTPETVQLQLLARLACAWMPRARQVIVASRHVRLLLFAGSLEKPQRTKKVLRRDMRCDPWPEPTDRAEKIAFVIDYVAGPPPAAAQAAISSPTKARNCLTMAAGAFTPTPATHERSLQRPDQADATGGRPAGNLDARLADMGAGASIAGSGYRWLFRRAGSVMKADADARFVITWRPTPRRRDRACSTAGNSSPWCETSQWSRCKARARLPPNSNLQAYARLAIVWKGRVDPSGSITPYHNAGAVQLEIVEPLTAIVTTDFEAPYAPDRGGGRQFRRRHDPSWAYCGE